MSLFPRTRRARLATLGAIALLVLAGSTATAMPDHGHPRPPVSTTLADWQPVADALGRPGVLQAGTVFRVGFPRRDLTVTSYGVTIKPGFALGGYAVFARYRNGQTLVMGDLVVTEAELPAVTDALQRNGIEQTAVHKHLLAHDPDLWWTHLHAVTTDPVSVARGIRAALDHTTTPPAATPTPPPPVDLDTAALDAALGAKGTNDGGIWKYSFARREPVSMHHMLVPPQMGITTALNFQPTGDGKAAINGDFVMTGDEVQHVIQALRAGGIAIVELHQHALDDQPRLFYMHFWANADATTLARTLHNAVTATNTRPL